MMKHADTCMAQHSLSPNTVSPLADEPSAEDVNSNNNPETSPSGNKSRRRPRPSRQQHPMKNGAVHASKKTKTGRNWSLLRHHHERSSTPLSLSLVHASGKEFSWMQALQLFGRVHPKEWIVLAVSLLQRHVYWPLLEQIRSRPEQPQPYNQSTTSTDSMQLLVIGAVVVTGLTTLLLLALSSESSFQSFFLQQAFYLLLFLLYCQVSWIAFKWILYVYDDPAIHRFVLFAKGWLQLVIRRGTKALQSRDSTAFIMAVSTLKAAPVGVTYIRYAIRYRMHNLNNVWMDDIARRHLLFLRQSTSTLQQFQEKITTSLQPSLHHLRKLSDSLPTRLNMTNHNESPTTSMTSENLSSSVI